MKILRFPRPRPHADRPTGVPAMARPDVGPGGDRDEARRLWAMAALQRPLIEALLARRAPARGILCEFRRLDGFGEDRLSPLPDIARRSPGNDSVGPLHS